MRALKLWFQFDALVLAVLLLSACSDGSELNFEARAGQTCMVCDDCAGIVASCVCTSCTDFAYDPETLQLLSCTSGGIWEVTRACPGGVSVTCAESGGYHVQCLDEHGQPTLG